MRLPTNQRASSHNRLQSLFFCTLYLLFVADIFRQLTSVSFPFAVVMVFAGSAVVMVSLGLFCIRYFQRDDSRRLRLGTILLLFVPMAVYLTAARWIMRSVPPTALSIRDWVILGSILFALAVLTTAVLLRYAEAIVWVALGFHRWRQRTSFGRLSISDVERRTVLNALPMRHGHFAYESGHHGELWIDLELLCLRPERLRPMTAALVRWLEPHNVEFVCGPLVEGAFLALKVAEELGVAFCYTQRIERREHEGLFPVDYVVPAALREQLQGKRVVIVNDVINAGSAVRATAADLKSCGAELVALATLATIGEAAAEIARQYAMPLHSIATITARVWEPDQCPRCQNGEPLTG